jgi:hypothetical protein
LYPNQKLSSDVIDPNGKPLEPKQHATKFVNQCGVIVRYTIPITVQKWNEPKKGTYWSLWKKLMENFILPTEYSKFDDDGNEILGGRERRRTVKEFARKKMAEAFRNYKKMFYVTYVAKKKTPVFEGAYEELRALWPEFVAYKDSERAKEMSLKK